MPKAIIVGAGHNGIVCAFYLASGGYDVEMFEQLEHIGGACSYRTLNCGCSVSLGATNFGMLRPRIIKEMDLVARGLRTHIPDPQIMAVFVDGESLPIYIDWRKTQRAINRFSSTDAKSYRLYLRDLALARSVLEPLMLRDDSNEQQLIDALESKGNGLARRFYLGSLAETLNYYFDNVRTKAAVAANSVLYADRCTKAGTAFPLLYLAQSSINSGGWGVVVGGMGRLTEIMANAAREQGVKMATGRPISKIVTKDRRAIGVELRNGTYTAADVVISNTDPITAIRLMSDSELRESVIGNLSTHCLGSTSRLFLLLDRIPQFSRLDPIRSKEAQTALVTMFSAPDDLERCYQAYEQRDIPGNPYLEMTMPTISDATVSCGVHHHLYAIAPFTPYNPSGESSEPNVKAAVISSIISSIRHFSPEVEKSVVKSELLSPKDIQDYFGIYGGNVDHVNMEAGLLFENRPFQGRCNNRQPISGLYLCGAGTHPGGLVTGAPGYITAQRILLEHRRAPRISSRLQETQSRKST